MHPWWSSAIIYHLYIKSFFDADNNGIGDIKGVTAKLDYLKELGIDAIWLSPFFDSPMRDNGYDIKDYYNVNPLFGTNDDLDELFTEMKKRDLKIIVDLVLNHTSSDHPWFQQALKDPNSNYRDYYIFRDKHATNNARSLFGNSTWEPAGDNQYYYHTFAKEQPDLNWENPALRQELYQMVNYWLSKGVNGFRLDAITYIKKNHSFPNLNPDDTDGLVTCMETSLNQPGILDFLNEFKQNTWGNNDDIFTVGEAPGVSFDELPQYIHPKGILTSVFDFSYTDIDITSDAWQLDFDWTYDEFQQRLDTMQLKTQQVGQAITYLENHDNPRSINKFFKKMDIDPTHHFHMATALQTFFLFLRGTAFLYQGQEIGMINATFGLIDQVDDLNSIDQYERAIKKGASKDYAMQLVNKRSRDHARTPVYWSESQFEKPWNIKPFVTNAESYGCDSVEVQIDDPNSILNFMKSLIQFKKQNNSFLSQSQYGVHKAYTNVISYKRVLGSKEMVVFINMMDKKTKIDPLSGTVVVSNYMKKEFDGTLEPYEAIIIANA